MLQRKEKGEINGEGEGEGEKKWEGGRGKWKGTVAEKREKGR